MDIIREATKLKEIALSIAKTKGISNLEAWPEAISIYKLKYEVIKLAGDFTTVNANNRNNTGEN